MRMRKYSTPRSRSPLIRSLVEPWVGQTGRSSWATLYRQSPRTTSMLLANISWSPGHIMTISAPIIRTSCISAVTLATSGSRNRLVVLSKLLRHLSTLIPSVLLCSRTIVLSSLRVHTFLCGSKHKSLLSLVPLSHRIHLSTVISTRTAAPIT